MRFRIAPELGKKLVPPEQFDKSNDHLYFHFLISHHGHHLNFLNRVTRLPSVVSIFYFKKTLENDLGGGGLMSNLS